MRFLQIKEWLNTRAQIHLKDFPLGLQSTLSFQPNRSLNELFSEFQYWLYPEESLPVMPVESASYDETKYSKTKLEIEYWQNPIRLHCFLKLDQLSALMRLHESDLENDPAVMLLAQIIFHKANENIIQDDGQITPFLTKEQQAIGLKLVRKYYDESIISMIHSRRQSTLLNALQKQNENLVEQIKILSTNYGEIKMQLDQSNKALDQILKNNHPNNENKEKPQQFGMFSRRSIV